MRERARLSRMAAKPKRKSSWEIKLDRAGKHFKAFRNAIAVGGQGTSDLFIRQRDDQTGEWVVTLGEIPEQLPAIVGDALQNLRSTLDHLVYDLVIAHAQGRPVSDSILEMCGFPVYGPRPMSVDAQRNFIGAIDPRARRVIEDLQPSLLGPQYDTHWLWRLHHLARVDRHRIVHAGIHSGTGMGISGDNLHIIRASARSSTVPGTEVARYLVEPIEPNRPMKVDFSFTAKVAFGDGLMEGAGVQETLSDLHWHVVGDVIVRLFPYLQVPSATQP